MKPIAFLFLLLFSSLAIQAQNSESQLIELDKGWEKALFESNVQFLDDLVSEKFVWVHNHATLIDGKEAVLNRARKIQAGQQQNDTRNRTSRDQQVVILGQTAVVSGFTVVDRGPSPTTYHFMRTYAWAEGRWKLLGNHTMAIPEGEKN